MKSSFAALAALLAVASASAQSSVSIFGILDVSLERVGGDVSHYTGLGNSANGSSALGFKGTEDLGGGLTAGFWLESGLVVTQGTTQGTSTNNQPDGFVGSMFGRRSVLTLTGNFGELRLGRDYVPSFWNYAFFDPFGAASVATGLNDLTGASYATTFVRASNSLGYSLPKNLGGVYGDAMVALGENASNATAAGYAATQDTSRNGQYTGLRLGYAKGPVDVAVSWGKTRYAPGTNTIGAYGYGGVTGTAAGDYTDASIGGAYDFGFAKVMGNWSRQKLSDVGAPGVDATTNGWVLGTTIPVGAGNILAAVSRVSLENQGKSTKLALGYVYNLSKRTALYAYGARVSNRGYSGEAVGYTSASFSLGGFGGTGVGAISQNSGSTGYDVGLRHSF